MKVLITEYLRINLDTEMWECRVCDHKIGPARNNYKEGLLVYDRNPVEIHKPLLDPTLYKNTFAPNPEWCAILEYYCPDCGTMVEAEYIVPGHPPVHDIELDIDALKLQWATRTEMTEHIAAGAPPRPLHQHGLGQK
jgi:acetone carboxylase gamma subunit